MGKRAARRRNRPQQPNTNVHELFDEKNADWHPLGEPEQKGQRDQSYRRNIRPKSENQAALMDAIQGGGQSSQLGTPQSSESLLRMLDALQQSEAALQKGLSEKVNFEVALLRAVEASQVRALDNLIRELKSLEDAGEEGGKKNA